MGSGKNRLSKRNTENVEDHFETHHTFHTENKYNNAVILNSEKLSTEKIVTKILKEIN